MKVLRVLSISNCPLVESQGSGYIILNFTRGLRARGHEVDLLGPADYEPLRQFSKAKRHRLALGILWQVRNHSKRKQYDVIEFYGAESWLAARTLAGRPRRNFLLVSHSNGLESHAEETQLKFLGTTRPDGQPLKSYQKILKVPLENAFTRVDGIVTVSDHDRWYALSRDYQPPDRIVTIENSLPDSYLRLPVNFSRPPVIGFCGSWLPNKGMAAIQRDIPDILKKFPEALFKLIGVGKDFEKHREFPVELCDRIEVIPFVMNREALREVYQTLAVLVAPSIYESFGLVMAEAMACGCAVVASKTGFARSLVPDKEVILMNEPRSPHLSAAVEKLLSNEPFRRAVAAGGYDRVQRLSWPAAVDALETTYQSWRQAGGFGRR